MKFGRHQKFYIFEKVTKYGKQIGIKYIPYVTFDRQTPKQFGESKRAINKNNYGLADRSHNYIYFHGKIHKNIIDLDKTIVHELIHIRFPNLAHGKKYEARIKEIRKGKTYPLYDNSVNFEE